MEIAGTPSPPPPHKHGINLTEVLLQAFCDTVFSFLRPLFTLTRLHLSRALVLHVTGPGSILYIIYSPSTPAEITTVLRARFKP